MAKHNYTHHLNSSLTTVIMKEKLEVMKYSYHQLEDGCAFVVPNANSVCIMLFWFKASVFSVSEMKSRAWMK